MIIDTHFIECLDKAILRQEKIMELLIREDKWINLDVLSEELQWAKKTIRKDVLNLMDILPTGWTILTSKGRGIRLIKPLESSLKSIIYLIRRQTRAYQIFETILNSKCTSILSLSNELYLSYRATREIVNKICVHLNKYGLELKTRPCLQIDGDEFATRLYINQFYVNVYVQYWPFESYSEKVIMNYLTVFENNLGITLFKGDKHRLAICLYTMMNRIKQNKKINMDQKDIDLVEDTEFFRAFQGVVTKIEKDYSLTISKHEIIYFTVLLMGSKYEYNDEELSKAHIVQRMRDQKDSSYEKIHTFINSLEKHLGLPLWGDDELLFQLSMCFRRVLFQFKIYSSELGIKLPQLMTNYTLVEQVKSEYEDIFLSVKAQFDLFFYEYQRKVPDEEIAIITLHIEAKKMSHSFRPVQILLYIAENQGMYSYVYAWLKKQFQNQVEIVSFFKQDIKHILEYGTKIIIISDIYLNVDEGIPIIKISNFPTNRDKQSIQTILENYGL